MTKDPSHDPDYEYPRRLQYVRPIFRGAGMMGPLRDHARKVFFAGDGSNYFAAPLTDVSWPGTGDA